VLSEEEDEEWGGGISGNLFNLLLIGLVLIFIGVIVVIVVLMVFANTGSAGGVIFIGPFPIVFGAGVDATWLITMSIIITIIIVVLFLVLVRRR
jgi:uncharacterized membrane protein